MSFPARHLSPERNLVCRRLMEIPKSIRPSTAPSNSSEARSLFFQNAAFPLSLVLLAMSVWAFLPGVDNDFVGYDDRDYITSNLTVQRGLSWAGTAWAFSSTEATNWHPLTWLSHMLDCQLYGLNPAGHHLTSLLLHAASTVLVFVILRVLTGATGRSFFVAALFGLHPLRVESVAWASERKDVLGTLFWLLTIWAYAYWVRALSSKPAGGRKYFWIALLFFSFGLMSKPMLVTLPFALVLLDYWPLDRGKQKTLPALLREKPITNRATTSRTGIILLRRSL